MTAFQGQCRLLKKEEISAKYSDVFSLILEILEKKNKNSDFWI